MAYRLRTAVRPCSEAGRTAAQPGYQPVLREQFLCAHHPLGHPDAVRALHGAGLAIAAPDGARPLGESREVLPAERELAVEISV